ncbi:DUF2185 domain-containing protein [Nocardioides solisilvae]|uniref:DUF2185 domain-containing protein n=1 Tax=Nocardioides solisilvae TaxID=1542435 RepID=UPI000D74EF17|nr:DUF2185 domain-containing protein [Nocardioides solisilvae]
MGWLRRRPSGEDSEATEEAGGQERLDAIEFIPRAGACVASGNVLSGAGRVRWMVREESSAPADNGWRIFSHLDTEEYLDDPENLHVADFNAVCMLEPALIGIWDLPVGSDLQLVVDEAGIHVVDTPTGREVPREELHDPTTGRRPR